MKSRSLALIILSDDFRKSNLTANLFQTEKADVTVIFNNKHIIKHDILLITIRYN